MRIAFQSYRVGIITKPSPATSNAAVGSFVEFSIIYIMRLSHVSVNGFNFAPLYL